mmetsp:Transcript_3768/g.11668  ORF Transcript_3768/g.11668 Transcript_3768/m.11668 type:complete len:200 (+) Transcript_3768:2520-3119(+)
MSKRPAAPTRPSGSISTSADPNPCLAFTSGEPSPTPPASTTPASPPSPAPTTSSRPSTSPSTPPPSPASSASRSCQSATPSSRTFLGGGRSPTSPRARVSEQIYGASCSSSLCVVGCSVASGGVSVVCRTRCAPSSSLVVGPSSHSRKSPRSFRHGGKTAAVSCLSHSSQRRCRRGRSTLVRSSSDDERAAILWRVRWK